MPPALPVADPMHSTQLPYVCHSAMPTKGTRIDPMREMMHFWIDFALRRVLPRHINHLPTATGHTHTHQAEAANAAIQLHNGK